MGQDTLSEVLRGVRLRGAVFYHVEGEAPWVAEAPPAADIAEAIMPGAGHVMEFHVVTRGDGWAALVGEPPVRLQVGDVVMFPRGDPHVISSAPGLRAKVDVDLFRQPRPARLPFYLKQRGESVYPSAPDAAADRGGTRLLCGFFGCDRTPFNPLLESLPPLLHVHSPDGDGSGWIGQFIRFGLAESALGLPGGEVLLERLSEAMFVEVVRQHIGRLPQDHSGWLAGLRDRHVGRALALLHESPAQPWTLERLADRVGLSRSALHERFARFTGYPPMHYLAQWRMQLASSLLRESSASIASVALEVGYESEAAFSRAFRRATGSPPSAWRRSARPAGESTPVARPP